MQRCDIYAAKSTTFNFNFSFESKSVNLIKKLIFLLKAFLKKKNRKTIFMDGYASK